MKRLINCIVMLLLIFTCFYVSSVDGRVGGGESYSSASGSSGEGGGGGSFGLVFEVLRLLLWLIVDYPVIGIPLTVVLIILAVYYFKNSTGATRSYSSQTGYPASSGMVNINENIRILKNIDPNFSRPLFMDFLQLLFTKIEIARGDKNWDALMPYIETNMLNLLKFDSKNISKVEQIIIGSIVLININTDLQGMQQICAEFESNLTEHSDIKGKKDYYVKEQWTLQRKSGVLSKGPESIASFTCPSCGNPSELKTDGTCPFCGMIVNKGDFHWQLCRITQTTKGPKPPISLSPGEIEAGTDFPTIYQPEFEKERKSFQVRYPNFSWQEFDKRVRHVFISLQEAWMKKEWEIGRPLETDYLFSTHRYWIERYKEENLTNNLEDIEIIYIAPVKIEQDAYFESITVRIKASMKDYTTDSNGNLKGGNKNKKRTFTEYWTFIRRSGFAKDVKTDEKNCPHCGAPMKISMSGICGFCDSKITSGEFTWILSMIEQDESYRG